MNMTETQSDLQDEENCPGVEIESGQSPPKQCESVINVENGLGKVELTEDEIRYFEENSEKLKKSMRLYPDNHIYDGFYNKIWEKDGPGMIYFPDGSKFEGFLRNDMMKRGRLIQPDGDYYEGNNYYS